MASPKYAVALIITIIITTKKPHFSFYTVPPWPIPNPAQVAAWGCPLPVLPLLKVGPPKVISVFLWIL